MADRIGQQLGNYRLIRLLGQGGLVTTYLGEHVLLGTQAAIKVFQTQLAPVEQEDFFNEERIIANLDHPHIVRIFDFGIRIDHYLHTASRRIIDLLVEEGKRVERGLYRASGKRFLNSDVNGSYNILRKASPNAFGNGVEAVAVQPRRLSTIKLLLQHCTLLVSSFHPAEVV